MYDLCAAFKNEHYVRAVLHWVTPVNISPIEGKQGTGQFFMKKFRLDQYCGDMSIGTVLTPATLLTFLSHDSSVTGDPVGLPL